MAMRSAGDHALAPAGTSAQTGQIGFGARFVEEDQPGRVQTGLLPAPRPAGARDVGPGLFAGVECLFLYVSSSFCST